MRVATGTLVRRRRPAAAAASYSFALTLLKEPAKAEQVASAALRKGAHSRVAVLAHARHLALETAAQTPMTSTDDLTAADPREVACQLAGSRPAWERAIVDLELRYGLDAASFARTLGLSTSRAAERSKAVADTWASALDPAMLAWLGPGACESLAQVLIDTQLWPRASATNSENSQVVVTQPTLAATGTDTALALSPDVAELAPLRVASLLDSAPAVLDHVGVCEVCGDRFRLMTSVRSVVGHLAPEPVPAAVADAAKVGRRRLPVPLPPSIEPRRLDPIRIRSAVLLVAGGLAILLGTVTVVSSLRGGADDQDARVARLLESVPSSRLLGTPSVITPDTKTASLANNGDEPITWHASSTAPWLTVEPSGGRLEPSQIVSLAIVVRNAPAHPAEATIGITGSDGSQQTLRYQSTRPTTSLATRSRR